MIGLYEDLDVFVYADLCMGVILALFQCWESSFSKPTVYSIKHVSDCTRKTLRRNIVGTLSRAKDLLVAMINEVT